MLEQATAALLLGGTEKALKLRALLSIGDGLVRVSVEGIKNGLYTNTVIQTKTFDMKQETAAFPDEFFSFVKELQEQLAEGKIDRILIQRRP